MKKMIYGTLTLTALVSFLTAISSALPLAPFPKSIYGVDNRQDYFAASPAEKRLADSVGSLWKIGPIEQDGANYRLNTVSFGESMNLCKGEKYSDQPMGAFCSGSLVGSDLFMTAGHCIRNANDCTQTKIVFGFAVGSSGGQAPTTIPGKDVYGCKELITRAQEGKGPDYALIRLDRAVADRAVLKINRGQQLKKGQGVFVIGYPVGIPLKVSGGASIRDASAPGFFVTDLDTFGGNSGSPVFNSATSLIEGILVRGAEDFQDIPAPGKPADSGATCTTMAKYEQNGGRGEDVTKVSLLEKFIPGAQNAAAATDKPAFQDIDANYLNTKGSVQNQDLQLNFR